MDFLNKLVIPLSPGHIEWLHYILMLMFFLFIPFISLIFGGTALSVFYRKKGMHENNENYLNFAKDIIDISTINKSMGLILGLLTLVISILIYVQLFHSVNTSIENYLIVALLLIFIGLILIYTYRYSLTSTKNFDALKDNPSKDEKINHDFNKLKKSSKNLSLQTGGYGLVILFIAIWIFIGGVEIATYLKEWANKNVWEILFSLTVISKLIVFLSLSAAFTGSFLLFKFFYWGGGIKDISEDYASFVRKVGIRLAFTGSLVMPLFLTIDLFDLPDNALSQAVFFYAVLAVILVFLGYQFLYAMSTRKTTKYSSTIFFIILLTIMSVVVKDQLAMINSTKIQTAKLSIQYEKIMQKLTEKTEVSEISGKEIYQKICSACHSFDHKVVGPPYAKTLPKYKGNVEKLVSYIMNPIQDNPGYPPMPNPGLSSVQAHAVAKYILTEVKKYEK